jgi:hypothetical protein
MNWHYSKEFCYHYLIDNKIPIGDKQTLAVFNFYGTLVWSERGELFSYNIDSLLFTSPILDIVLEGLKSKGYTLCILEIIKKNTNVEKLKATIMEFIQRYNLNIPAVLIAEENIYLLNKIMCDFFKPLYKFGKKSFYCADEIDYYDSNPWYRLSETDSLVAKSLNFNLYKPEDVLGSFVNCNFLFMINDLIITCGQEYSGYEIFYEAIDLEVEHLGMECKLIILLTEKIYIIQDYILDEYYNSGKSKIIIKPNTHYVIVGSNPSVKDRQKIASMFEYEDKNRAIGYTIAWFSRHPYQKSELYRRFLNNFDSPLRNNEKWFRFN